MQKAHILLAEDDPDDQFFFKEALESVEPGKYELLTLSDGQKAIDYIEAINGHKKPDFLVLDLNMPKINGLTVLRNLKKIRSLAAVPVFILSTTTNPFQIEECKQLGCVEYYIKPLDVSILSEIVHDMLRRVHQTFA